MAIDKKIDLVGALFLELSKFLFSERLLFVES